jgi:hypothetical protein
LPLQPSAPYITKAGLACHIGKYHGAVQKGYFVKKDFKPSLFYAKLCENGFFVPFYEKRA